MQDIVAEMGPSFLGTRLKRLGERMQASANVIIAEAGLPLQPGHMGVIAALRTGPLAIGRIAELCGTSQPGVTRAVGQLQDLRMVEQAPSSDQRSRVMQLTAEGRRAASLIAAEIWPRVGQAAEEVMHTAGGDFLRQLAAIEAALADASIAQRAARLDPASLRLREYEPGLAHHFHDINAEWITTMFQLEATDRDVLENPDAKIIAPGGTILFVEAPGFGIVGTCALQKTGDTSFELTKMGVREAARGLKAGEFLLAAVIDRARSLGADPLYLLTNSICAPAIHLYAKLGFCHDKAIMAQFGARYQRCDVAMRYAAG